MTTLTQVLTTIITNLYPTDTYRFYHSISSGYPRLSTNRGTPLMDRALFPRKKLKLRMKRLTWYFR